jgi:hypothetical protein
MRLGIWFVAVTFVLPSPIVAAETWKSHLPLRAAPAASNRPLPEGSKIVVDAEKGDDEHEGTEAAPLRSVQIAITQALPGETIVLRGGVYFERVTVASRGSADKPITLRSWPGETAIIDGGLQEFSESPAKAWQPVKGGASGEFRSLHGFPNIRDVVGAFSDSMIGLNTYFHRSDLQATNELIDYGDWDQAKTTDIKPLWCGPGLWYDAASGHIHCRLSHTHVEGIDNYRGETDPRKLPLIVAPFRSVPLTIDGAAHVRVQDLTIRGAGYDAVVIDKAEHVEFDNVTVWCGSYGIRARATGPLKLHRCGLYGSCPPWLFRTDTSKRAYPGRPNRDITRLNTHATLVLDSGREFEVFAHPCNDNWEIAYCEFTDSHDGPYLGGVSMKFHHNLIEGTQDDGVYLSPMYPRHLFMGGGAEIHISQNVFRGCLTALAFGGSEDTRDRVFVYRNVFDLRPAVLTGRPTTRDRELRVSRGKLMGDHGSPPWSAMNFYHNTVIAKEPARDASMAALSATRNQPRRAFNNVFVHFERLPGFMPPVPDLAIEADGNLYWAPGTDEKTAAALFQRYRASKEYAAQKEKTPDGVSDRSLVADPRFAIADWNSDAFDFRLSRESPAVNSGVALPSDWPDPVRTLDQEAPDRGAIPLEAGSLKVGRSAGISGQ